MPPGERVAAMTNFEQQIRQATSGQWSAQFGTYANGTAFVSLDNGKGLFFDAAGNMYGGFSTVEVYTPVGNGTMQLEFSQLTRYQ
jgi:hypothetical protein